ncbi:MAG: NAD(+) diphosphatase [Butyricicoccus sp.]|nr:NAD(+) diphosphatase [Butyricicoccus sp.]
MLQEIAPHVYHNEFCNPAPRETDLVTVFDGRNALLQDGKYPTVADMRALGVSDADLVYLFSVDDTAFFLLWEVTDAVRAGLQPGPVDACRTMEGPYMALAGSTALHLYRWYRANRFCGCCGAPNRRDDKERAMRCTKCNAIVYPTIAPAIVVAIRDGDRIVLTKYADRATPRYALIAGFIEIGETMEDTVRREAMEEVGLKIKNLRYHGNQPWGFSGTLMLGFWADLDGDDTITLDRQELKEGVWMHRDEVPETPNPLDLTHTMMELFRKGLDPKD